MTGAGELWGRGDRRARVVRRALLAGPEAFAATLASVMAVWMAGSSLRAGFPVDDAWIHLVYGLAVRRGEGLAYNTRTAATGCTSPLWDLFAAMAHMFAGATGPSLDAALALKVLGIVAFAGSAALSASVARACAPRRRGAPIAALAAGVTVALAPILAYAAVSGMEVALTTCLMLGALLLCGRARFGWAGLVAGLSALARPEAALTLPLVIAMAWLHHRKVSGGWMRVGVAALAGALPIGLDLCRNALVSGRPLPATFYRKSHLHPQSLWVDVQAGFRAILGKLAPTSSVLLWALVAVAIVLGAHAVVRLVARPRATLWSRRALTGATALLAVAYVAGISSITRLPSVDSFYFERYVLPPVPLLVVAAVSAAMRGAAIELPHAWARTARRSIKPILWLALSAALVMTFAYEIAGLGRLRARYATNVADTDGIEIALGRFVGELPPGAVVWSQDAGAIRYFGQHPTVDLNELNTPELFTGGPIPPAWWPDAIVVSLVSFAVVASPAAVREVFKVTAASDPANPLGWQSVFRCLPAGGGVAVQRHGKRIAQGRCARAGGGAPIPGE